MSDQNHYYIIGFNTDLDMSDPNNPKATTGVEFFCPIGSETEYFESMMVGEDRLPCNAGEQLQRARWIQRFNPHRYIRLYGVIAPADEETMRELVETNPKGMEEIIKPKSVKL